MAAGVDERPDTDRRVQAGSQAQACPVRASRCSSSAPTTGRSTTTRLAAVHRCPVVPKAGLAV